MNILSIQTLFELRKIPIQNCSRIAMGRVFFLKEKIGLCDATGLIWPCGIASNFKNNSSPLKQGDCIIFEYTSEKVTISDSQTQQSDSYLISLHDIKQKVSCYEQWENKFIANPLPSENLSKLKINFSNNESTSFYSSPTSTRFHFIKQKNRALERTKQFFVNRGFLNIESPTLVPSGGIETYLNSFVTQYEDHRGKHVSLQLPTSPEFALKKILCEGTGKVFQLARAYRNRGELSRLHEPEFIMLEWYRPGENLAQIMKDTQNLVSTLAKYLGSNITIPTNWPVFRVDELFKTIMNLDITALQNTNDFYCAAENLSPSLTKNDDWDTIFCKLFMEKVEPFLKEQKACFVTHYPIQMGALATQEGEYSYLNDSKSPNSIKPFVHRCEAYLLGVEICNAYLELVDYKTMKERFLNTQTTRSDIFTDPVFENALAFGMPPCSGNALGLDRVIALLLELNDISSLYAIPFLSQFLEGTVAIE